MKQQQVWSSSWLTSSFCFYFFGFFFSCFFLLLVFCLFSITMIDWIK